MIKALRKDGLLKKSGKRFSKGQFANKLVPFDYHTFFSTFGNIVELDPADTPRPPMEDAGFNYIRAMDRVAAGL